jgi:hypothetical protein
MSLKVSWGVVLAYTPLSLTADLGPHFSAYTWKPGAHPKPAPYSSPHLGATPSLFCLVLKRWQLLFLVCWPQFIYCIQSMGKSPFQSIPSPERYHFLLLEFMNYIFWEHLWNIRCCHYWHTVSFLLFFSGSVMNAHMSFSHKRVDPYLC